MPTKILAEDKNTLNKGSIDSLSLIPVSEYRTTLRKFLKEEYFQNDRKHIILYFISMAIFLCGIYINLNIQSVLLKLLLSFIMGIALTSLTFFLHDLFHGSIFSSKKVQYLLGLSIGIFNLFPPLFWKRVHSYHHVRTGNLDDPDRSYIKSETPKNIIEKIGYKTRITNEAFHPMLSLIMMSTGFLFYFSNALLSSFFPSTILATNKCKTVHLLFKIEEKIFIFFEILLIFSFQFFLFKYVSGGNLFNYFFISLLPIGIAHFTAMLYIHTNHFLSPLTGEMDDPLINSLSLKNSLFVDKLFSNFSHHTEHHLFPSMGSVYYPKVRKLLLKLYPERFRLIPMSEAIKSLMKTPRIYYDYTHLVTYDGKTITECPTLIKK